MTAHEGSTAFRHRWWTNFGEDGFWAYWLSIPWRCRLGWHRWEYEGVNVAPEVVSGMTGGYDRCQGCERIKDVWGYV